MTNTYTIPAIVKDELQKKLEKLSKKANTYGNHLNWSFSDEFVATRNVYNVDPVTKTQIWTDEHKVFVVDVTIDSDIIKKDGYVKSDENQSTKSRLMHETRCEPSAEATAFAQKMQDELSKIDYSELTDFLRNVKTLIDAKYCRMNAFGYLAYAPIAFKNMMKKREQEQSREEAKGLSNYVGNVGERITADVKDVKLVTSWETLYGWTHLYKFTTTDNNTLVWFASKCIDENLKKITGTIKDHSEYDGEKQTILTRCKVM